MIKINNENRQDIIRSYSHRLIEDMDIHTLYSFAYNMLLEAKNTMDNSSLESEIAAYCPDILEN